MQIEIRRAKFLAHIRNIVQQLELPQVVWKAWGWSSKYLVIGGTELDDCHDCCRKWVCSVRRLNQVPSKLGLLQMILCLPSALAAISVQTLHQVLSRTVGSTKQDLDDGYKYSEVLSPPSGQQFQLLQRPPVAFTGTNFGWYLNRGFLHSSVEHSKTVFIQMRALGCYMDLKGILTQTGTPWYLDTQFTSPLRTLSSHRSFSFSLSKLKPATPSIGGLFSNTPQEQEGDEEEGGMGSLSISSSHYFLLLV